MHGGYGGGYGGSMSMQRWRARLEARLHVLERLCILVGGGEGDGEALGAKAAGAAHAVEVRVGRVGHVVCPCRHRTRYVSSHDGGARRGAGLAAEQSPPPDGVGSIPAEVQLTTMLTRSMSMPRPQMSVETRMRCLKSYAAW